MSSPVVPRASTQPLSDLPSQSVDAPLIEVFGLLLEANARLVAHLDRELVASRDMSLQYFEVLIRLARSPGESLTAGELARAVALSSGGATRLIDRLEAAGLVVRHPGIGDRRVVRVGLTGEGRTALLAALPVHLDGLERHLAGPLADSELTDLEHALRSVRDGFDSAGTPTERPLTDSSPLEGSAIGWSVAEAGIDRSDPAPRGRLELS